MMPVYRTVALNFSLVLKTLRQLDKNDAKDWNEYALYDFDLANQDLGFRNRERGEIVKV